MVSTVLRIDDGNKWSHPIAAGAIKVKVSQPFARDLNAMYGIKETLLVSDATTTRKLRKSILVDDELAIKIQMLNILGTPLGSEDFEPTYGSNLPFRLFEAITDTTAFLIENDTIDALRAWMRDRISIVYPGTEVIANEEEDCYIVNITHEIVRTGQISELGFKLLR